MTQLPSARLALGYLDAYRIRIRFHERESGAEGGGSGEDDTVRLATCSCAEEEPHALWCPHVVAVLMALSYANQVGGRLRLGVALRVVHYDSLKAELASLPAGMLSTLLINQLIAQPHQTTSLVTTIERARELAAEDRDMPEHVTAFYPPLPPPPQADDAVKTLGDLDLRPRKRRKTAAGPASSAGASSASSSSSSAPTETKRAAEGERKGSGRNGVSAVAVPHVKLEPGLDALPSPPADLVDAYQHEAKAAIPFDAAAFGRRVGKAMEIFRSGRKMSVIAGRWCTNDDRCECVCHTETSTVDCDTCIEYHRYRSQSGTSLRLSGLRETLARLLSYCADLAKRKQYLASLAALQATAQAILEGMATHFLVTIRRTFTPADNEHELGIWQDLLSTLGEVIASFDMPHPLRKAFAASMQSLFNGYKQMLFSFEEARSKRNALDMTSRVTVLWRDLTGLAETGWDDPNLNAWIQGIGAVVPEVRDGVQAIKARLSALTAAGRDEACVRYCDAVVQGDRKSVV